MHRMTRRELVKTLLALGAGGVFLSYARAFAADDTLLAVAGGEPGGRELFAAVSALVTLRDNLDPGTVTSMYEIFKDEPWATEHMKGLYAKVRGAASAAPLTDGERWFAGHLLTTWYLGIYYHEQRPVRRVTYRHALMFDAASGLMPVPYLEANGFGSWTEKP